MRRRTVAVTFVMFDLLGIDGEKTLRLPHRQRRAELEALKLEGACWTTPETFEDGVATFEDGVALFDAVCEHELEGVVAKRCSGVYRPGERGGVKIKNRSYGRYGMERESAHAVGGKEAQAEPLINPPLAPLAIEGQPMLLALLTLR